MKTWIIEPRDTLVIRDGRPLQEGSPRMFSLDFPWPSTIAGFARTRIGTDVHGKFSLSAEKARGIAVKGPWLAELDEHGQVRHHLVPAPHDCVFHEGERVRLGPIPTPAGCATDLQEPYRLLGPAVALPKGKAMAASPFWRWSEMASWLATPAARSTVLPGAVHAGLVHERRTHVAIDASTQTAGDGQLFSTDGLRFSGAKRERLGIVFACDDARLREGPALVGGERRLSFLRPANGAEPTAPRLALGPERRMRVVLLTPAVFANGFAPAQLGGAKVIAAAVPRAEVISGWDFELRSDGKQKGPKPTRRMAPAGSVYWVELDAATDVEGWVKSLWMTCVSEEPQDRLDGFGLAVVGVGS